MDVVNPVCCGLDVHKRSVTACLRTVKQDGSVAKETRDFGTTLPQLLELGEWLATNDCPIVAMESTGVYWRPVFHVVAGLAEVVVGNPADMKRRPGRKTDKLDATWISELLAHGLIPPSFVPPPDIQALRDLTRHRVALVQSRTQVKNRVHKVLEDTNIKLASVVSDLFGKSSRRMLAALIAGERDPEVLADLAMGVLRKKIPDLVLALQGNLTPHHIAMIQMDLEIHDMLHEQIQILDGRIAQAVEPYQEQVEQLKTIPGVEQTAARDILSEIGSDMTRFVSSARLASWAGMSPPNEISAGKRKRTRGNKGNRYLRRLLASCAWACRDTDSFLGRTFRRLQARIGGKKAAIAVGHKILVIVFCLLERGQVYNEQIYDRPNPIEAARRKKAYINGLEALGYAVSLQPN